MKFIYLVYSGLTFSLVDSFLICFSFHPYTGGSNSASASQLDKNGQKATLVRNYVNNNPEII